jgi:hypothetical protein
MTERETIKFDLLANAKDSLRHAVLHIAEGTEEDVSRWKIAIRETAHVIELLLKERLSKEHPALIWVNVDEYLDPDKRTINAEQAVARLNKISRIRFSPEFMETLKACRKLRNSIEHYEFHISELAAKAIVGRMLSSIFQFSKTHLKVDLEAEFRADDTWKALIELSEFWEAHRKVIEQEVIDEGHFLILECPLCHAETFIDEEGHCRLCGHENSWEKCDICSEFVWGSEMVGASVDEYTDINVCKSCIEANNEAEYAADYANYEPDMP